MIVMLSLLSFLCVQGTMETVFTGIYEQGCWTEAGFSLSGSEIEVSRPYVAYLQEFIRKNNIRTVVDFGCGDWQSSRHIDWSGVEYVGYDVVKYVVERNQMLYAQPSIVFLHADGLEIDLPKADLLICKDVLQHFTDADIFRFLGQLHKFKHCLITNYVNPKTYSSSNADIPLGAYRAVDLTKPPFNIQGEKVLNFQAQVFPKQVLYIQHD